MGAYRFLLWTVGLAPHPLSLKPLKRSSRLLKCHKTLYSQLYLLTLQKKNKVETCEAYLERLLQHKRRDAVFMTPGERPGERSLNHFNAGAGFMNKYLT